MKMKKTLLLAGLCLGTFSVAFGLEEQQTPSSTRSVSSGRNDLIYLAPAKEYYEAMPFGNGRLGGMLRNLPDGLACQLNHVSFFAGSGAENNLMNTGEVTVRLPKEWMDGFVEQRLVLYDGLIRTIYKKGASTLTATTWMAEGADALVVQFSCSEKLPDVQLTLSIWDRLTPEYAKFNLGLNELQNLKLPIFGVTDGAPSMIQPGIERSAAMFAGAVGAAWSSEKAERLSSSATLKPDGKELTIIVAAPVIFNKPADVATLAAAQQIVSELCKQGIAKARSTHDAYWHGFWNKTGVIMSSEDGFADFAENMYQLFLYWMAGCSRGEDAPKFNGANYLFCNDWRSWGAWYWYQNTREMYWPLLASDHADFFAPFVDLYWRTLPASQDWAKKLFNAPGACVQETLSPRTGNGCKSGNPGTNLYHTTGTEAAFQIFQYYEYTGDMEFLRTRAYPFLKEVLAFHISFLKKEADGKYHVSLSSVKETYRYVKDSVTDLAALRIALSLAIATSEKLGVDPELRDNWKEILANLAPFVIDPDDGTLAGGTFLPPDYVSPYPITEKVLPPGEVRSKDKKDNKNCENVACDSIYPWGVFNLSSSSADLELARKTFAVRKFNSWGYGNAWDHSAPSAARLGLGEEAATIMKTFVACDQYFPNGFCGTPGNMPDAWGRRLPSEGAFDAPGVFAVAVQEMQLQSNDRLIRVYPAWPKGWRGEFTLMAKDGFRVSSMIGADGAIPFVKIESRRGSTCRIVNPWTGDVIVSINGKTSTAKDRIIQIETKTGDLIELKAIIQIETPSPIVATRNDAPKIPRKLADGETSESYAKNSSGYGMLGIAKDGSNPARVIVTKATTALKRSPAKTAPIHREKNPLVTVYKTAKAPVIDGDISDECWKDREAIGPFFRLATNLMAQEQTQLRITWNEENLYLSAICHESHPDEISASAGEDKWAGEDNIEIFLANNKDSYWQICLNAKGGKNDLLARDGKSDNTKNLKVIRATKISNDNWTLEAAIPFKDLGWAPPADSTEFRFNVARNELPNRELSTFAPFSKPAFHLPDEFARAKFSTGPSQISPVAFFTFDGEEEAAAFDSSGMGWIGTFANGAVTAPGKEGNAVSLDGKGFFEVPFSPFFNIDDELTVDVWVKPENKGARVADNCDVGKNNGFLLDLYPDNQVRWITPMGVNQVKEVIPSGAWTHLIATVSYSKGIQQVYINGELKGETKGSGGFRPNAFTECPLRIGADSTGGSNYKGLIDSLRISRKLIEPNQNDRKQ